MRPASGPGNVYALWRLSDATDERDREEAAFSHLQYIINYLDHAPAGFFSTQPDGQIAYVNATLAGWLGLDLAQTTDGTLTLADLVGPDSAKLIARIDAEPGSVRTETFDIDLQSKDGRTVPVRIIHPCRLRRQRTGAAVALARARPARPRQRPGVGGGRGANRAADQQRAHRHRAGGPRRQHRQLQHRVRRHGAEGGARRVLRSIGPP